MQGLGGVKGKALSRLMKEQGVSVMEEALPVDDLISKTIILESHGIGILLQKLRCKISQVRDDKSQDDLQKSHQLRPRQTCQQRSCRHARHKLTLHQYTSNHQNKQNAIHRKIVMDAMMNLDQLQAPLLFLFHTVPWSCKPVGNCVWLIVACALVRFQGWAFPTTMRF